MDEGKLIKNDETELEEIMSKLKSLLKSGKITQERYDDLVGRIEGELKELKILEKRKEFKHPEEPHNIAISAKNQYMEYEKGHEGIFKYYKELLKKAYSLSIAKTDIDLMIYFLAKYTDLNKRWNLIAKAKSSREIRGLWTGSSFVELERGEFIPDSSFKHCAEKLRIYFTHDFLRAMLFPLENTDRVLYFLKNVPVKYNWSNRYQDIVANEIISLKNLEKVYIHEGLKKNIKLIKKTKRKYPHIEFIFFSDNYLDNLSAISDYSYMDADIGFLQNPYRYKDYFYIIKKLLTEKQNTLNKLIKLNEKGKELKKEQANSYRLYLEGIDIDIDFLIKLEKNIKLFQNFYSDNKDSFDKLKLVENKLQGIDITFKEFRTQWDDWFPHLEQYDYFKNIIHSGGYASKLSRQINEEINKIDSGEYDNDDFKDIEENSGVEFKDAKKELGGKFPKKTYIDKKGNKWMFKPSICKSKVLAEVCSYEFAKLIDKNAVEVRYFEHNGEKGNLQIIMPNVNTLEGIKIEDLKKEQLKQFQMHSIIDWLIGNRDAKEENFLINGEIIYGIDKGRAFHYFESEKSDLSYMSRYSTYYYKIYKSYVSGKINLEWNDIEPFIKKVESISDSKYLNIFRPFIEEYYKRNLEEKREFIKLMLNRKRNLRNDFENLYKSLAEKRQKNGFPVSDQTSSQLTTVEKEAEKAINNLKETINELSKALNEERNHEEIDAEENTQQ